MLAKMHVARTYFFHFPFSRVYFGRNVGLVEYLRLLWVIKCSWTVIVEFFLRTINFLIVPPFILAICPIPTVSRNLRERTLSTIFQHLVRHRIVQHGLYAPPRLQLHQESHAVSVRPLILETADWFSLLNPLVKRHVLWRYSTIDSVGIDCGLEVLGEGGVSWAFEIGVRAWLFSVGGYV